MWANIANSELICLRWYLGVTVVVNPNLQNKFMKKMMIHSSAKTSVKMNLIQIVREMFQCYIVEDFFSHFIAN